MKFTIITNVNHIQNEDLFFSYSPYVREMNIWMKYADEVIIVAPLSEGKPSEIDISYNQKKIDFRIVPAFNFVDIKSILYSLIRIPLITWRIFWAMKIADHIHLRCPGNMGLLGCFVQILFPSKTKTAKYAGNWDPKSKQPWTYNLQKRILSNKFLTRKMTVLVYGEWENQSKNIKPFFTATYSESEKEVIQKTDFNSILEFVFVGSLVVGKNPMYAITLVENLVKKGNNAVLSIYGDGIEKNILEDYIKKNQLEKFIFLRGNQNQETIKNAYKKSHFVVLPSRSEGWPKAIAEAMFWGCVPIATNVSCVPFMIDYGKRGVLLHMNLDRDTNQIKKILKDQEVFKTKSALAMEWSRKYTTDVFESKIEKIIKS